MTPGCLILAAGAHRRFGSAKLLHPLADGRLLIQHTLTAIGASGLPMALVHRPDDQALLAQITDPAIQRVPNPGHAKGMGHSIATGVRATAHWDGWIICLADMPTVLPSTYAAIAAALRTHAIVIPHFQHQAGHPRGFQRQFFPSLMHLDGDQGARGLLTQHPDEISVLSVPDAGILLDIDYPQNLNNLAVQPHKSVTNPNSDAYTTGSRTPMTENRIDPNQDTPPEHQDTSTSAEPQTAPEAAVETATGTVPAADAPAPPVEASATDVPVSEMNAPDGSDDNAADHDNAPAVAPVAAPAVASATESAPASTFATASATAFATASATASEDEDDDEIMPMPQVNMADIEADSMVPTEAPAMNAEPDIAAEAITAAAAVVAAPVRTATPVPAVRFRELPLDPRIMQATDDLGFEFCTPIQALALPRSLQGKDVIGKAQTGTGKTAAFLITVLNHLLTVPEQEERYNGEPRALILAPTRELAIQIEKDARTLIKHTPITLMSIVGGMDYQKQQRRLQNEIIDIVVGTPGRLIDFVKNKDLFLSETEILVIDEADRMLDMGFIPDVKRLVRETPFKEYRQTLMFSATFTQDIMNLSGAWTRNAEHLEVESDNVAADTVDQKVYIVTSEEKFALLYNLINQKHLERVMIFANRRDETRDLTHKLRDYGIKCAMLSGEVPQEKRIKVLEGFREGKIRVMVATDVAGRGIHIDDITHVINYTLPEDPEDYVHRIGRTGRAGKSGTSISFACEEDAFQLPAIEVLLGAKLDCAQPEEELLAPVPPPDISPEQMKERESHTHNKRRRPPRRQSGNR